MDNSAENEEGTVAKFMREKDVEIWVQEKGASLNFLGIRFGGVDEYWLDFNPESTYAERYKAVKELGHFYVLLDDALVYLEEKYQEKLWPFAVNTRRLTEIWVGGID